MGVVLHEAGMRCRASDYGVHSAQTRIGLADDPGNVTCWTTTADASRGPENASPDSNLCLSATDRSPTAAVCLFQDYPSNADGLGCNCPKGLKLLPWPLGRRPSPELVSC